MENRKKMNLSPAPEPSKIDINLGFKSTRDFNSVSVNIGITDYVRKEETLDEAVDRVYEYVNYKVVQKLQDTKKEIEEIYEKRKSRRRQQ